MIVLPASGPLSATELATLEVRREATQTQKAVGSILMTGHPRDPNALLMAFGSVFLFLAAMLQIEDPSAALQQIADLCPGGAIPIDDDPAKGRFVHPDIGHA